MRGAQFNEARVDRPPEVGEALRVPRDLHGFLRELPEPPRKTGFVASVRPRQ